MVLLEKDKRETDAKLREGQEGMRRDERKTGTERRDEVGSLDRCLAL